MTESTHPQAPAPVRMVGNAIELFKQIPYSLIAFIGRFAIAAVFWKSGQTKVSGLEIDIVSGTFTLGIPTLSPSAIPLFTEEYKLPFLSPELAATLAAVGEHVLPVLILFGLATRFSALGLLVMTLVIQLLVYPSAYPTHGVWAAVLLILMSKGPGIFSIDHLIARRYGYNS
ncbi:DoxX family protein [Pseudomonas segetis]